MRKIALLVALGFISVFASLGVSPASAQATRTWVSGVGDDVNPCSRTAPCKTFAGAISKTAAGGEINCIDPGGFGAVTITKSMAIKCDWLEAGILVSGTNGVIVNGAGIVVYLSGLDFEGLGAPGSGASPGLYGINFLQGAELHVVNCVIRGFQGSTQGYGINFVPGTTAGTSFLSVTDTIIENNGSATSGGGILIQPGAGVTAKAVISRTHIANNRLGIRADGTGSTGGVSVAIADSVLSNNVQAGATSFTPAGGAPTAVQINRTTVANNGTGINANGAAAILRIGSSVVTGNTAGNAIQNGATMTSFGNNQMYENPTGAGPTLTVGPPL
jgi:hypothetical protein